MKKKTDLLNYLRKEYPELKFEFKEDGEFEYYLLYKALDPKRYAEFGKFQFIQKLDDLCEKILNDDEDDELEELVIVYDCLNEIEKIIDDKGDVILSQ